MTSNRNVLKYLLFTSIISLSCYANAVDERTGFPKDLSHKNYDKKSFFDRVLERKSKASKTDMVTIKDVDVRTDKADESVSSNPRLREYIKKILEKPLTKKEFERYVLLIMEIPGFEVQDELKGSVLMLNIKRQKATLGFAINNLGTKDLGKEQGSITAVANQPFFSDDKLAIDVGTSTRPKALKLATASYSKILNTLGTSFSVVGSTLKSNPSRRASLIAPNSTNNLMKAYFGQQLLLNNTAAIVVDLGVENRNIKTYTVSPGTAPTFTSNYKYTEGFIGAKMRYKDSYKGENLLFPTYHKTFDDAKIKTATAPDNNFDKNFQYFTLDYIRDQELPIKNTTLFVNALWHTTNDKLPSEKQFFSEVQSIGRGYTTGLINSDKGVNGTLELRYTHHFGKDDANRCQVYGFYNAAHFTQPRDTVSKKTLQSAGVGGRMYFAPGMTADVEVAQPFSKHITVAGTTTKNKTNAIVTLNKTFSW